MLAYKDSKRGDNFDFIWPIISTASTTLNYSTWKIVPTSIYIPPTIILFMGI